MGVTLELEGTNSEGDFGVGGGVTFQHRNLAHGGEMLTAKFRGAYESLSGSLDGLINDNYTEVAAELGITFPKFKAPFLSSSFKQKMRATTEFAVTFMRQERPEYTRIIGGGTWRYKWTDRANSSRRTFDLIDINVVNLPKSTIDFIDHIAPDNPLLRYSYEDHFIMSMGYRYYNSNKRIPSAVGRTRGIQPMVYTIRASAETAGNLLYIGSRILAHRPDDGVYDVFNTSFSQYVRVRSTMHSHATSTTATRLHSTWAQASDFPTATRACSPLRNAFMPAEPTECADGACAHSVRAATTPTTP